MYISHQLIYFGSLKTCYICDIPAPIWCLIYYKMPYEWCFIQKSRINVGASMLPSIHSIFFYFSALPCIPLKNYYVVVKNIFFYFVKSIRMEFQVADINFALWSYFFYIVCFWKDWITFLFPPEFRYRQVSFPKDSLYYSFNHILYS